MDINPGNCTKCGEILSPGAAFCIHCGFRIPEAVAAGESLLKIPFEERRTLGFWASVFATWKLAALDPTKFYPLVGKTSDTFSAILFYIVISCTGVLFYFFISIPFRAYQLTLLLSKLGYQYGTLFAHMSGAIIIFFTIAGLLLAPFVILLMFYLGAAGWHVALLIVNGAPYGFQVTVRTLAYASAPALIPFVGGIWSLIMKILGLAHAHQTDIWRPLVAWVINMIFLLICFGVIALFIVIFIVALIHGAPHS